MMDTLDRRIEDGCLYLTLNRPQARNAMSRAMVAELGQAIERAGADDGIRVVVLRGAGGHFCAGADIGDMAAARAESGADPEALAEINRGFGRVISALDASPKTVIAVLEGAVLGGGLGLACVSDVAIVRADARLGLPETTLGLPPAQIIPFVVARIGLSQARRLALTGARLDGAQAFELGLAHLLCADGQALEKTLAETIEAALGCAPHAAAQTKALLLATRELATEALLDRGARAFAEAALGDEAMEGTLAFMQKRKPRWAQKPPSDIAQRGTSQGEARQSEAPQNDTPGGELR
ncbi:MAG: enoyl-CoA hydratase/isomerase family protein [Wenzhouxiangellaceae bacterium]|nr:enoyl-CoA hydratase/isomerase family protein [Wenzhouxiangellaceae bacterium]